MVQVLLVLVVILGLCTGSRAETIAPLAADEDGGVLLMVTTGQADKIRSTSAVITSEVTTRDRYTIVYILYSYDHKLWLRSAVKNVSQNHHDVVKIKLDNLVSGKQVYYQSHASSERGISAGNLGVFLVK